MVSVTIAIVFWCKRGIEGCTVRCAYTYLEVTLTSLYALQPWGDMDLQLFRT